MVMVRAGIIVARRDGRQNKASFSRGEMGETSRVAAGSPGGDCALDVDLKENKLNGSREGVKTGSDDAESVWRRVGVETNQMLAGPAMMQRWEWKRNRSDHRKLALGNGWFPVPRLAGSARRNSQL